MNVRETVAIIDLGTNTFHLLIVEIGEREEFVIIEKYKEPVKLGENGIQNAQISNDAFQRGLKALSNIKKLIDSHGATQVFAYATSAIRSAENGKEFIQQVKQQTGIEVSIINGNEEAAFIYTGIKNGIQLPYDQDVLMIDIGGGSVEFIVANSHQVKLLRSLNIGVARLLDKFRFQDQPSSSDIGKIHTYFAQELKELLAEIQEFKIKKIVGSSGSFETIAALIANQNNDLLSLENLNGYKFNREKFLEIHYRLLSSNRSDRAAMPGMDPMRIDIIVYSSILIHFLMQETKATLFEISLYALKEGILYDYLDTHRNNNKVQINPDEHSLRLKAIRALGKKYQYDSGHATQTAKIALSLFDQTRFLHHYGLAEKELLEYAAIIHDIGHFIARSGHHKHGQYVIMNSGLQGFSTDELILLGNIVRYHRKGFPTRDHLHFNILPQDTKLMVRTLSGILRIADNLDRGHRGMVRYIEVDARNPKELIINIKGDDFLNIEVESANEMKGLLEQVFNQKIVIQQLIQSELYNAAK
ncbi:MAG: Ppx/GppA family phosphatase [Bacteroidia bacterium]|nr:Ppx/GppA family phosphatase [Bacteroidia bacterium]